MPSLRTILPASSTRLVTTAKRITKETYEDTHSVHYLLINPPLTDPTAPYHSIPYLIGSTVDAGFQDYACIDANIESLNYLAKVDQVKDLLDLCETIRIDIENKPRPTRGEELLYRYALKAVGLQPDSILKAITVMKDANHFFNYETYRQASLILNRWIDVLSVKGFPGQYDGFYIDTSNVFNISSISDLTNINIINRLVNPFIEYFNDSFLEKIKERNWNFIALSVNYVSQLPFALWLCRYIRSIVPNSIISVGGTEISDIVKNLQDKDLLWALFPHCDLIMVGEGETSLVNILRSIQQNKSLPKYQPGVLIRNETITPDRLSVTYEDVSSLPMPKYDVWLWDQYWSPEPVVLYSPTRGCYWNKCTFCDYGLNTSSPTSPSRERPVEIVVKELKEISRFARIVYFAVDAMSPSYLRRLARAIFCGNIHIQWSAELRLENSFTEEVADELRRSGCVCVSFGYESGSQRILDLINKGVAINKVPRILEQLSNANIGVQMMGFTGFPGETQEESMATYQFLKDNRENWTLAGIGDFSLTPGSIIAKQYNSFGISKISFNQEDDIIRWLSWSHDDSHVPHCIDAEIQNKMLQMANSLKLIVSDRPFVGGIDSGHSILYFSKFGRKLLPTAKLETEQTSIYSYPVYARTPFSSINNFTNKYDIYKHRRRLRHEGKPANFQAIMEWLNKYPMRLNKNSNGHEQTLEIEITGEFISMSREFAEAEKTRSCAYYTVKNIMLRGLCIS